MKCPACLTQLVRAGKNGDPLVSTRGLLIKGGCLLLICPKCKGDVRPSPDVLKALSAVLIFTRETS